MSAAIEVKYFNTFILKKIRDNAGLTENPIWNGSFGIPSDLTGGYPETAVTETDENWIIEEARIRGGFNNTSTDYGAKAYLVEEEPAGYIRFNALIYSGIFNSRTGINNTNVFSTADEITRATDPSNGSIQKLYAEDTNPAPTIANYIIRVRAADAGLDDEADYSVSLDQVGAIQNEEIIPIIRQDQNASGGTGPDDYCTIPHIKIRVDASTVPGQNGYYLFTGPMGGTFNQLKGYVSDSNTITIDRTNAYDIDVLGPPGVGYNCGAPNSNTFLYSSVDFATVLAAANSGGCNDALQCDECGPGPCSEVWEDLTPIDISNFNVEII